MTRTVVRGKASFALHELYAIVHEGVRLGHRRVREGVQGLDVHQEIQDLFARQGYKTGVQKGRMQGFFHGTGHGVGLQIHEAPSVGKRPCVLRAGHVVTIEPGLYYLGLGGVRIEDMALVRQAGLALPDPGAQAARDLDRPRPGIWWSGEHEGYNPCARDPHGLRIRDHTSDPTRSSPSSARGAWAPSTAPATPGWTATWRSRSSSATSPRTPTPSPASSARPRRWRRSPTRTSSPSTTSASTRASVYAAMELLEGETLRERLKDGALPVRKAIELALQIAHGLAAAHDKGITHRDLKPENIFLTDGRRQDPRLRPGPHRAGRRRGGRPGHHVPRHRARPGAWAPSTTWPRSRCAGTRSTPAPTSSPSARCSTRCSPASAPSRRATPVETMNAILKEDPPSLFESSRSVSPALERIVQRCLEKRPEDRPRTVHDLAIALDAIATGSTRTWDATTVAETATKKARRRRLLERLGLVAAGARLSPSGPWPCTGS